MNICKKVKDFPDYEISQDGVIYSLHKGRKPLAQYTEKTGYNTVWLSNKGKLKKFHIHRLVAEMFIENPENKPCVNHKNSIRTDNRISNLEWATYSENNLHAKIFGFNPTLYGEDVSCAKLTNSVVLEIYQDLLDGLRNIDVAKKYDISPTTVAAIKTKSRWGEITKDLPNIQNRKRRVTFSEATVHWICERLQEGWTSQKIVDESTNSRLMLHHVKDIRRRLTYKSITEQYKW